MVRRPMPGQLKMVSVTIAPASSAAELQAQHGDDGDHGVAQGMAIDHGASGRPLARAVRM